jgi:hypothetical protein
MQDIVPEMLAKRRDRAIAVVLGIKERECDQYLPKEARNKLRKAVLDQFNEFYDVAIEMARSLDQGDVVLNEIFLDKINDIHMAVVLGNGRP